MAEQQDAAQAQPPGCDKSGMLVMGVFVAIMFGYHQMVYVPQLKKFQEEHKQWRERNVKTKTGAKTGAKQTIDAKTGVAPPSSATPTKVDSATAVKKTDAKTDAKKVDPKHHEPPAVAQQNPRQDGIAFRTEQHAITLSTAGASLSTLTFTNEKDPRVLETIYLPAQDRSLDKRTPKPFQPLHPYIDEVRSFAVTPLDKTLKEAATADWKHEHAECPQGGHQFSYTLPNGLVLRKLYLPAPPIEAKEGEKPKESRHFHFLLRVRVENPTGKPISFGYHLNGPAGMVEQEIGRASAGQEAVMASRELKSGRVDEVKLEAVRGFEKLGAPDEVLSAQKETTIAFYGLVTKYFAAVVAPSAATTTVSEADAAGLLQSTGKRPSDKEKAEPDGVGTQGVVRGLIKEFEIKAGTFEEQRFLVYVGPRQDGAIFEQPVYQEHQLKELVYYGWFGTRSIGRVLLWALSGLQSLITNWGIAILVLTFLVRGMMLPLSMYSQKNMLRMQTLAPEINKLKEKFSNKDGKMSPEQQRAFSAAQMELWRRHGVNPIGCIGPIFLQMPIFIGLYNALNYSSALRHSPFMGWINDLSTPDILFRMPFSIPILDTNAFSVLPLLMVATYMLQQKVQPKPTDPKMAEQQKIMKFIFPLFGFILYTMPAGLMLYFITSSLWGIAEQKVIKGRIAAQEAERKIPAAGAALPGLAAVGQPKVNKVSSVADKIQAGKKGKKGKKKKR